MSFKGLRTPAAAPRASGFQDSLSIPHGFFVPPFFSALSPQPPFPDLGEGGLTEAVKILHGGLGEELFRRMFAAHLQGVLNP